MKNQTLEKHGQNVRHDVGTLAEHARALVSATADVAEGKVVEARKRLSAALDSGKEMFGRVRDKAVEAAEGADEVVRENPYKITGLALAIGALLGFLLARRK